MSDVLNVLETMFIRGTLQALIPDHHNGWRIGCNLRPGCSIPFPDTTSREGTISIASEIERDLISKKTTEGLRAARAKGKLLGRPKGAGKSKLDQYREEIIALLKTGSTQVYIAKRYKTTQPNLFNWLKKHKLSGIKPEY